MRPTIPAGMPGGPCDHGDGGVRGGSTFTLTARRVCTAGDHVLSGSADIVRAAPTGLAVWENCGKNLHEFPPF